MKLYYCHHCGKARQVKPGYIPIDDRFAVVICDDSERAGHADRDYVYSLLKLKRERAQAKRAATIAAKKAATWSG